MTDVPALRLTGGMVLSDGTLHAGDLALAGGRIVADGGAEVDARGYWLLPGIVDMHGDGFERHLAPRSGVGFALDLGLASCDAELCANGVTTAYLAQSFSWEGGKRGADFAEALVAAHGEYRGRARADMRLQLRYETHFVDGAERMLALVRAGAVDYVVFNDHLPEALANWRANPGMITAWAAQAGRTAQAHMAVVHAAAEFGPQVAASLARIAAEFRARGLRFGSHDDADAATRARYDALGARVCEFPTGREAAVEAQARGNPVLMGAPNVVRGGSQSGNIAAEALIAEGLCDVLVSDYYYPALAAAAWALTDRGVLDFASAWAMISANSARQLGLADRGVLREGARADVVAMDPETRRIEAAFVAGRPVHLTGELAARLCRSQDAERLTLAAYHA